MQNRSTKLVKKKLYIVKSPINIFPALYLGHGVNLMRGTTNPHYQLERLTATKLV